MQRPHKLSYIVGNEVRENIFSLISIPCVETSKLLPL